MKKIKISLFAAFAAVIISLCVTSASFAASGTGNEVDIVFTSDLHSFIDSYETILDGQQKEVGGFARLKTYIDSVRAVNEDALVVDCGDIVSGTLSQALMSTEAPELTMLSMLSFDAITYGNHEFDNGAYRLGQMYSSVADRGINCPKFVICNIDWTKTDEYTNTLRTAMEKYGYADYVIIEKNGVKIAVTGVIGYDAIKCAPDCELTFLDPIEAVKDTVKKIKDSNEADMIVCLSHSGTGTTLGNTEDEKLAKAVPDIDVIVSGHTHTVLKDEITVGNTYIGSCGSYGVYTGHFKLSKNTSGRWNLDKYELVEMNESIAEDPGMKKNVRNFKRSIDEDVLSPFNYRENQVLALNDGIPFESYDEMYDEHREIRLGNVISDAYRYMANSTPTGEQHQFDIAVAPSGTIRTTILDGEMTVGESFEMLSLGEGNDGTVGYPLVSFYLSGKEIKTMAEVDATLSDIMKSARLFTSGVCFEVNKLRLPLNRVCDIWLNPAILDESRTEIDDNKLYRCVTDMYSVKMIGAVTDLSKGLLSMQPKSESGELIKDYNDCIIYDSEGRELKAWSALAGYLDSLPTENNGISTIPDYYATTHNRKTVIKSLNPAKLFKNINIFAVVIILVIVLIILTIVLIIRSRKKKKNRKKVFIG